jgi:hypothetical protein
VQGGARQRPARSSRVCVGTGPRVLISGCSASLHPMPRATETPGGRQAVHKRAGSSLQSARTALTLTQLCRSSGEQGAGGGDAWALPVAGADTDWRDFRCAPWRRHARLHHRCRHVHPQVSLRAATPGCALTAQLPNRPVLEQCHSHGCTWGRGRCGVALILRSVCCCDLLWADCAWQRLRGMQVYGSDSTVCDAPRIGKLAWHGMAWHGMAWHGMAWHDTLCSSGQGWLQRRWRSHSDSSRPTSLQHRRALAHAAFNACRAKLVAREGNPASESASDLDTPWAHLLPAPEPGCILLANPILFTNSQQYFARCAAAGQAQCKHSGFAF